MSMLKGRGRAGIVVLAGLATPGGGAAQQMVVRDSVAVTFTDPGGRPTNAIGPAVGITDGFVVVESETNSLIVISRSGRVVSRLDNLRPTGAMLSHPVDIALASGGDVLVLDGQTPRIARFKVAADGAELVGVTRLGGLTGVSALCSMATRTFVSAASHPVVTSGLIQVVEQDGEITDSFGHPFGPTGDFARALFGASRLVCVPEDNLVVVASQFFPEVRAYSSSGELRWTQELAEHRGIAYTEEQAGLFQYAFPADSLWDHTRALFEAGPGVVALQLERRYGRAGEEAVRGLRTVFFSTGDGRRIGEQRDLPLVRAISDDYLFVTDLSQRAWVLRYDRERGRP